MTKCNHTNSISDGQPQEGQTRIELFTDGSCISNPGYGGYGIVTLRRNEAGEVIKKREKSGFVVDKTTNIRMEMTAICVALECLGKVTDEAITLICDAKLIPDAMNEWLPKWKVNGWRKSSGKAVENRDLWERLLRAAEGRNVTFKWVRGHSGNIYNETADRLASKAARTAQRAAWAGSEV